MVAAEVAADVRRLTFLGGKFGASLRRLLPVIGLAAAFGVRAAEQIPELRPPVVEIPPDFWELHGTQVSIGSTLGVVAVVALVLLLLRKKPPVVTPPAVAARRALEALRGRPETLALAGEVSQIIRHYVLAKLGRAGEEPTTEELVRALSADARFSPAKVQSLAAFLRDCDVQKFAPATAPQPDVVTRALALVDQLEQAAQPPLLPPAA
ncbi:MAG: hypothetical protein HY301_01860 [Verrucomicrobia bacterium]|nr:hypothetical protein [Verrucomicrobiota bacterium]